MAVAEVWRAGDVADLYGVDDGTVYRWERAGRLRPSRRDPGGVKYWLAHEVLEDLAAAIAPEPQRVAQRSVDDLVAATRRPRRRAS